MVSGGRFAWALGLFLFPVAAWSAPIISSISPATAPTAGGTSLTIVGYGFLGTNILAPSKPSVTISGVNCPITSAGQTGVVCTLPPRVHHIDSVVVVSGGQASNAASLAYYPPVISNITPATGSTSGGTALTLLGSNLWPYTHVQLGSSACSVSGANATQVVCVTPAGQGTRLPVTVVTQASSSDTPDVSNAVAFSYNPPVIGSISPSTGPVSGGFPVTLLGSNFGTAPSVTMGSGACQLLSASHTQIVCMAPASSTAQASVVVTAGGQSSPAFGFTYNTTPTITSISPATAATSGGTVLTIVGGNFGTSATATVNRVNCPVVSATNTMLTCSLPAGQGTNLPVMVTANGQASNTGMFSYSPPSITSLTPATAPTSGGTLLTIVGSSFGTTPTVTLGGAACPLVSGSHTQIVCTIPAGQGTNQQVVVTAAAQSSKAALFSYMPPTITSISPTTASTSGGTLLTIVGSSFGLTPSVTVNKVTCPVQSASHTMVTCTLPAGQGTSLPVVVTTAGQSSNVASFSYAAPSIASISPANGPTSGGFSLTLQGQNFGTAPSVTVGNTVCPIVSASQTSVSCTAPAGSGSASVNVNAGGQLSNALSLTYQ